MKMLRQVVLFFNSKFKEVCLKVLKVQMVDVIRIVEQSTNFENKGL
jgi:hypothetical protein